MALTPRCSCTQRVSESCAAPAAVGLPGVWCGSWLGRGGQAGGRQGWPLDKMVWNLWFHGFLTETLGYFREVHVFAVSRILLGGLKVEGGTRGSTGLRALPFVSKVKTTSIPKALTFASFFWFLGWTTALVGTGNYSEWKYSKGRINYLQPNWADQARGVWSPSNAHHQIWGGGLNYSGHQV